MTRKNLNRWTKSVLPRIIRLRNDGLTYSEINSVLFKEYGTVTGTKRSSYRTMLRVFGRDAVNY